MPPLLLFLAVLSCTLIARAESLYWQRVGTDFDTPVDLVELAGGQFIVVEKPGRLILTNFRGQQGCILDLSDQVRSRGREQGLLGIALDPKFSRNGRIYLNLINTKKDTEVWRYTLNPRDLSQQTAAPQRLLQIPQPYGNHNGGWMGFGPDGMLYIATGDGGSANDPKNLAQDLNSLLGKVLRLDVSPSTGYRTPASNPYIKTGRPEIYAVGLRNPWRCFWHGQHLIIADVGQNDQEEVNYLTLSQLRGANFGWRLREGNIPTPKSKVGGAAPQNAITPVLTYSHDLQQPVSGISITGGIIYTGKIRSLKGRYLFADFGVPRVWAAALSSSGGKVVRNFGSSVLPDEGQVNQIASISRGRDGEAYLICLHGEIFTLAQR